MRKKRMSGKESNQKLLTILKQWQKIEERSVNSLSSLSQKVKNPLVKEVLKIIRHDSQLHRLVQQFMINSMEKKAVSLSPDELAAVWTGIQTHIKMERASVLLGQRAKESCTNFVHRYLINYLLTDERKHDDLLEKLEDVKKRMYPYG